MQLTADEQVAIVRFVTVLLEVFVAVVAVHYRFKLSREPAFRMGYVNRLLVTDGVMLQAAGWAIHQAYWWVWQMAIARGAAELKSTLEVAAWVTVGAYAMIWVGCSLSLAPYARRVAGSMWPAALLGLVCGLLVWSALIVTAG